MVEIEDEGGLHWFVYGGDPAWPLIKRLPKLVSYFVLPRATILTGVLTYPPLPSLDISPEFLTNEVKQVVIRLTRLQDILYYLGES